MQSVRSRPSQNKFPKYSKEDEKKQKSMEFEFKMPIGFYCGKCPYSCNNALDLKAHMTRLHRNFCPVCSQAFIKDSDLLEHQLTHIQVYRCSLCSFFCPDSATLENHKLECFPPELTMPLVGEYNYSDFINSWNFTTDPTY